jgi:hypothetical protein
LDVDSSPAKAVITSSRKSDDNDFVSVVKNHKEKNATAVAARVRTTERWYEKRLLKWTASQQDNKTKNDQSDDDHSENSESSTSARSKSNDTLDAPTEVVSQTSLWSATNTNVASIGNAVVTTTDRAVESVVVIDIPAAGNDSGGTYVLKEIPAVEKISSKKDENTAVQTPIAEIIRSIVETAAKSATDSNALPTKGNARSDAVAPVREAAVDRITPVDENVDEPVKDPLTPRWQPPFAERAASGTTPLRTVLPNNSENATAFDDTGRPAVKSVTWGDFGLDMGGFSGTFVLVATAPVVGPTASQIITGFDEVVEELAPTALQAAGAVSRFVPFDPASLKDSVGQFIESLRTKNLDEGSGFGLQQVALWTAGLLGCIATGEMARRKKIVKQSHQWLSTTFSKWLTLPVRD